MENNFTYPINEIVIFCEKFKLKKDDNAFYKCKSLITKITIEFCPLVRLSLIVTLSFT